MADSKAPLFARGSNLAMKVPGPLFEETVAFDRDAIGLPMLKEADQTAIFAFGAMNLHIDRCPQMSQAEIWLKLTCRDSAAAAKPSEDAGSPVATPSSPCRPASTVSGSPAPPASST